jgi:hypothetical protein
LSGFERLVLASVPHVGEHRDDFARAGLAGGVLQLEQFEVGVARPRRGDDDDALTVDGLGVGLVDRGHQFAVREALERRLQQRLTGLAGQFGRERLGRGARKYHARSHYVAG